MRKFTLKTGKDEQKNEQGKSTTPKNKCPKADDNDEECRKCMSRDERTGQWYYNDWD